MDKIEILEVISGELQKIAVFLLVFLSSFLPKWEMWARMVAHFFHFLLISFL